MRVTVSQLAAYVGRSERTVQRWLNGEQQKIRLEAQDLGNGYYEVSEAELQHLARQEFSTAALDTLQRIEANQIAILNRLERIEAWIAEGGTRRQISPIKQQIARAGPEQEESSDTQVGQEPRSAPVIVSQLPGGLVGWRAFARLHGIGESTVQKAIEKGKLEIEPGEWKVEKAIVKGALNQAGRARFYRMFRANVHWQNCPDCPHDGDQAEQRPLL